MSYLKYLTIAILLLICSCSHQNQMVVINSDAPKVALDKYYNKKLNLKVFDKRDNKEFIGFRTLINFWKLDEEYKNPKYFDDYLESSSKVFSLNNNQDLAQIIKDKLAENLNNRGLKIKRFTTNQVIFELLELSVVPATLRTAVEVKIKVKALNKMDDFEKIYEKKITYFTPAFGPNDEYYNEIINDCLDKNIKVIISDSELWNFLD
jgi:uncharacterized lipoprotein YajG